MSLRVLLTGASGYLGGVLAQHLAAMPEVEQITGIALSDPAGPLPAKMKFIRMDIRSPELQRVMAGHDVVVHTACIVLWPAKMPVAERDDINLNGVRYVAEAALANKVRRFVHASSMAVYDPMLVVGKSDVAEDFPMGDGDSPYYYWNGKAMSERTLTAMLGSSDITLTCLRPIYIIGPGNRPAVQAYRQNAVRFLGYNPRRQFVHEDDVASAFVQAVRMDLPGAFNVAADDSMRLYDVWKVIGKKFVPTVPLWLGRWLTQIKWQYFGSNVHPSWVADMLVDLTGSNAKLKRTGWKPRYRSLEALQTAL
jgi:nucleoside-diphosphate-sugar epimerase